MVYLALGILAVTLSITLYQCRSSAISPYALLWRRKEQPNEDVAEHSKTEHGRGTFQDIPTFTLDDGDIKTPQQNSALERIKPVAESHFSPAAEKGTMPAPTPVSANAGKKDEGKTSAPLMPPPSRPTSSTTSLKTPPKPSTALRPPPSAASALRAPPTSSLKPLSSSLAPSISTLAPSARPSKKVLLDPGHSPLDWAHLTANPPTPTFLRGADVPANLIRVPPSALRYHSGRKGKDAWGVYQGKVYNLTPYMKFHPGGVDQLMRGAGKEKEGEQLFSEIHPWVSWENMLGECLIGILVSENEVQGNGSPETNQMEEMD